MFILKHVLVTCFEFHLEKLYLRFTKDTNENLWGRDGSVHITFHTFHTFRTLNCFYSFLTYAITILIINFVDIIFFLVFYSYRLMERSLYQYKIRSGLQINLGDSSYISWHHVFSHNCFFRHLTCICYWNVFGKQNTFRTINCYRGHAQTM